MTFYVKENKAQKVKGITQVAQLTNNKDGFNPGANVSQFKAFFLCTTMPLGT